MYGVVEYWVEKMGFSITPTRYYSNISPGYNRCFQLPKYGKRYRLSLPARAGSIIDGRANSQSMSREPQHLDYIKNQ